MSRTLYFIFTLSIFGGFFNSEIRFILRVTLGRAVYLLLSSLEVDSFGIEQKGHHNGGLECDDCEDPRAQVEQEADYALREEGISSSCL